MAQVAVTNLAETFQFFLYWKVQFFFFFGLLLICFWQFKCQSLYLTLNKSTKVYFLGFLTEREPVSFS